jgi:tetratricopeptide (TPR) repeat protein
MAWYGRGNALDELGKYNEAIKSYNKAIEIDANIPYRLFIVAKVFLIKGIDHYDRGEYVTTICYYDEAIKQDQRDENAWYNKANALRMLHRNSEAEAAYAKARELGTTEPSPH